MITRDMNCVNNLDFKYPRLIKYLALANIFTVEDLHSYDAVQLLEVKNLSFISVLDINDALVKSGFAPLNKIDTIHQLIKDEEKNREEKFKKEHEKHERYMREREIQEEKDSIIEIPIQISRYKQKISELKIELSRVKAKYKND